MREEYYGSRDSGENTFDVRAPGSVGHPVSLVRMRSDTGNGYPVREETHKIDIFDEDLEGSKIAALRHAVKGFLERKTEGKSEKDLQKELDEYYSRELGKSVKVEINIVSVNLNDPLDVLGKIDNIGGFFEGDREKFLSDVLKTFHNIDKTAYPGLHEDFRRKLMSPDVLTNVPDGMKDEFRKALDPRQEKMPEVQFVPVPRPRDFSGRDDRSNQSHGI